MKILIVDDDSIKVDYIKKYLSQLSFYDVVVSKYRNDMFKKLQEDDFDYIILDNNFPIYEDSRPEKDLGIKTLMLLERSRSYQNKFFKNSKIILCSSDEISETFSVPNYLGNIVFDSSVDMKPSFSKLLNKEEV